MHPIFAKDLRARVAHDAAPRCTHCNGRRVSSLNVFYSWSCWHPFKQPVVASSPTTPTKQPHEKEQKNLPSAARCIDAVIHALDTSTALGRSTPHPQRDPDQLIRRDDARLPFLNNQGPRAAGSRFPSRVVEGNRGMGYPLCPVSHCTCRRRRVISTASERAVTGK